MTDISVTKPEWEGSCDFEMETISTRGQMLFLLEKKMPILTFVWK